MSDGKARYRRIYRDRADEYDALVGAEDCDGRLRPALEAIAPLAGATVLEAGAGTGRVTRLLLAAGARVVATEPEPAMLALVTSALAMLAAWRFVRVKA